MSREFDHPATDSPQFDDAPSGDQPGMPPPAGAPGSSGPDFDEPVTRPTPQSQPATTTAAAPSASPAPAAQPADVPQRSRSGLLSNAMMMLIGAGIGLGTFFLGRAYSPPQPPGEVAGPPPADMVKADDFKRVADRVDQMAGDLDQAKKQLADRPDYSNQFKLFNDRLDEVQRAVAQMTPQFDSLNQKISTLSKVEDSNSPGRVDAVNQRLADLSRALDATRGEVATLRRSNGGPSAADSVHAEGASTTEAALQRAITEFAARKYPEAKEILTKLQASSPDDARVWYYSALANGFATSQWLGETERLVKAGMDKEKAGQPSPAQIDESVANLTPATGKTWLADYRKRIKP